MSHDGGVAFPRGAMELSAVCDCGISRSCSLTIFVAVIMAVQASTHQAHLRFMGSGRQCTCKLLKAFMKNCSKKCNSWLPSPRSDSTTLPWSLGHTSHWDDIDCNTCPSGSAKSRVPPVHRGWLSR